MRKKEKGHRYSFDLTLVQVFFTHFYVLGENYKSCKVVNKSVFLFLNPHKCILVIKAEFWQFRVNGLFLHLP